VNPAFAGRAVSLARICQLTSEALPREKKSSVKGPTSSSTWDPLRIIERRTNYKPPERSSDDLPTSPDSFEMNPLNVNYPFVQLIGDIMEVTKEVTKIEGN